jgi:hypothetical protein
LIALISWASHLVNATITGTWPTRFSQFYVAHRLEVTYQALFLAWRKPSQPQEMVYHHQQASKTFVKLHYYTILDRRDSTHQMACNCSARVDALERHSMKDLTASNSTFDPASNPPESWKTKPGLFG